MSDIKNNTLDAFQTAVRYQMFHSIALVFSGILIQLNLIESKLPLILFIIGIIL